MFINKSPNGRHNLCGAVIEKRRKEMGKSQRQLADLLQIAGLDIDKNADDWNGEKLPDKTDDAPTAGIKIPGFPSITLPKGQKTVNVALLNPEGNPCYFTFEIVLKDTGGSLYKSKLVPPGKAITEITMSRALPAGEYDATIKITTTSVADGSAMNGANVETVLIVK